MHIGLKIFIWGVLGLVVFGALLFGPGYAASTVRVEAGQILASDGLYKIVRHPMYAGNVVMMTGIPLALGSYWAMFILVPGTLVLVFRILDEEKLLTQELSGYREYRQLVRYRLVPYVW